MTPAHREMSESLNRDMFDAARARHRRGARASPRPTCARSSTTVPSCPKQAVRRRPGGRGRLRGRARRSRAGAAARRRGGGLDRGRRLRDGHRRRAPAAAAAHRRALRGRAPSCPAAAGSTRPTATSSAATRSSRTSAASATTARSAASCCASTAPAARRWPPTSSCASCSSPRRTIPSRPIVVSMSDLAASGGYYIALAGDEIVAQPGTLTGSIGIYSGKIVYGGTLEKVGVTREAVTSGANADIYSPLTAVHARAAPEGGSVHARLLHRLPRQDGGVAPQDARRGATRSRRAACGPARRRRSAASSIGSAGSTWRSPPSRNAPSIDADDRRGDGGLSAAGARSTRRSRISSAAAAAASAWCAR